MGDGGKGSAPRKQRDDAAFAANWDKIFGSKEKANGQDQHGHIRAQEARSEAGQEDERVHVRNADTPDDGRHAHLP